MEDEGAGRSISTALLSLQPGQDIIERMANRDPMPPIAELPGLYDPDIAFLSSFFLVFLQLRVIIEEKLVLGVFYSLDDVEGERECLEDVHLASVVIGPHVVEESLLVAYVIVLLQVVVNHQVSSFHSLQGFTGHQSCPLEVGSLVDHDFVLGVAPEMPAPVFDVDRIEDATVELVSLSLQLIVRQQSDGLVKVVGGLLLLQDRVDLQLGPDKVGSLGFICQRPPKSALDECLDHEGVVAAADVGPVDYLLWLRPHE